MSELELPFRQIHLDFHTSECIEGIGAEFDPDEFAETLEKARVNSVTCFARCHHGWIYYQTKRFPERRHPHLTCDLLREQIEACHARGIRVPIYITVQWDHYTAKEHPEWLQLGADGRIVGTAPYEAGFYRRLCLNSSFVDEFLKPFTQEVLETFPVDGIFFDIVGPQDCSCRRCREAMEAEGLEPADEDTRLHYGLKVINEFKRKMTAFIRQFNKNCTIFYNAGHIGPRHREVADAYTHFELESLPSGGWGYLHFPIAIRYARTLRRQCLGMTAKFHTSWGDFHSFKSKSALEFECFNMLALGAKCSVGDQLHPRGKICQTTYELIGSVYREVEKKEKWCRGAKPVTELGVLTPEQFTIGSRTAIPPSIFGATRMLQEASQQFDILDSQSDLSPYRVLILPDEMHLTDDLSEKLHLYLRDGGSIIASFHSGLNIEGSRFLLDGIRFVGNAPFSPDFIVPGEKLSNGLSRTEYVMYERGLEVETEGEVLAEVIVPYFNRTYKHFCSHRHTPSSGKAGYPGVVRVHKLIYFVHPIFTQYHRNAPWWVKRLFLNALEFLLPDPLLRHNAPTTLLTTINEQTLENRWLVHLLHYIPERRGEAFDVIEDVIPLFNLHVSVRVPRAVEEVCLVPEELALEFCETEGRVEFTVPELRGHRMVSIQLA